MTALASQITNAVGKHQSGELVEAERLYREILKQAPDTGDALNLLGVLCGQTGRIDESLENLQRAATVRPAHPQSRYNLGNLYRQLGRLPEALVECDAAIKAAPQYAAAHLSRSLILWDLQRADDAIDAIRTVLKIDPGHIEARSALAEMQMSRGEIQGAAEQYETLVEADPTNVSHRVDLGIMLHRLGRLEEAVGHFRRATELQPQQAAVWCNLGESLRAVGRTTEAIEALEKAVELDPTMVQPLTNLAEACLACKNLQRAMAACHRALELAPSDTTVHWTTARALLNGGELAMAEDHLRIALQNEPDSPGLLAELGDLLRRLERFEEADEAYRHALRVDPKCADAVAGRVESLLQRSEPAAALELAESARRTLPDDVTIASALANALIASRHYDQAASLLQDQIEGGNVTSVQKRALLFRLGDAHDKTGDYAAAWAAYEQANRLKETQFMPEVVDEQVRTIREVFSRANMVKFPRADACDLHPVFLAGMPRTGTSLLEQILDSHPDLAGGGEMGLMGRIIGRIGPLTGIAAPYPQRLLQMDRARLQKLARFAAGELAQAAGGKPFVTEKTPANLLFPGLIELLFPQAKILWCLRNPLDTCLSCYFHDFAGALPFAYDLRNLGFYYRKHEELLHHWRETTSLPLMTVQYEEMVDDQEGMTRRVLEFCGLPWNDACLEFHRNRRVTRTASTQQVHQPIYRSSVNRHLHYEQYIAPLKAALAENAQ